MGGGGGVWLIWLVKQLKIYQCLQQQKCSFQVNSLTKLYKLNIITKTNIIDPVKLKYNLCFNCIVTIISAIG